MQVARALRAAVVGTMLVSAAGCKPKQPAAQPPELVPGDAPITLAPASDEPIAIDTLGKLLGPEPMLQYVKRDDCDVREVWLRYEVEVTTDAETSALHGRDLNTYTIAAKRGVIDGPDVEGILGTAQLLNAPAMTFLSGEGTLTVEAIEAHVEDYSEAEAISNSVSLALVVSERSAG